RIFEEDESLAKARLLLRVGRLRLLHARDVAVPERVVADGRGHRDHRAGDVRLQPLAAVDVVANAALCLVANILRAGVDTQHQDRARALLSRVGVVAVADGPPGG